MQNQYQKYMNKNAGNGVNIFVKIHANVLASLEKAKQSIRKQDIAEQYKNTKHAADLISRLRGGIVNSGVEGTAALTSIYERIYRHLNSLTSTKDSESDIDGCIQAIEALSKMWATSGND